MADPPLHLIKLFENGQWHAQATSGWPGDDMTLCMEKLPKKYVRRSTTATEQIQCAQCLEEMETRSDSALWIPEANVAPATPAAQPERPAPSPPVTPEPQDDDEQGNLF